MQFRLERELHSFNLNRANLVLHCTRYRAKLKYKKKIKKDQGARDGRGEGGGGSSSVDE